MWGKVLFLCLCFQACNFSDANREKKPTNYGGCRRDEYLCENQKCLNKTVYCDGVNDCGDNSDEIFCRVIGNSRRTSHFKKFECSPFSWRTKKIIPEVWRCDGVVDCKTSTDDESNCGSFSLELVDDVERVHGSVNARQKIISWLHAQRHNVSGNSKWGVDAPRIAVALYLADANYFNGENKIGNELAYEIDNQVLLSMLRVNAEPVSSNELALYIHALLVTCSEPREFHGINLVEKLRHQVNSKKKYVSPFVILALCNANDTMTTTDIDKLTHAFTLKERTSWTSTQALALMALSCIAKQRNGPTVNSSIIANMSAQLKRHQFSNGSFENVYITGLVMQALFASGTEDDSRWNMTQAVSFLVRNQEADGSYGNLLNTYFILPILYYKDLTNISFAHCRSNAGNESFDILEDLDHKTGKRFFVKYTLWLGDKMDVTYSLKTRVVENMTVFDLMNVAKALDSTYDFSYSLLNSKPYIYRLAGHQDDPEHEKYWFLYRTNGTGFATIPINLSPVDIVPKGEEEYIMWYRSAHWIKNQEALLNGTVENNLIGTE